MHKRKILCRRKAAIKKAQSKKGRKMKNVPDPLTIERSESSINLQSIQRNTTSAGNLRLMRNNHSNYFFKGNAVSMAIAIHRHRQHTHNPRHRLSWVSYMCITLTIAVFLAHLLSMHL
ncbi:uncharacterized protein LOC119689038 [Teleopsis dalmanni]|uniref:uncharacterized protein LOC119689038 n=1 Tax=Teleopsis dalmanni TaxID=139649 RepID=UPI0018CDB572|nr:uncharacterized protein LOC119689038 [Teleopsis dalmanni]